ncbi:LysR family transcriptional regulator [Marinomonas sp. 15G1-11]|uniref:LysR family transcriptional regulator n=1 Tax=Marinomonas phaeophyticola TaxID=3004091 RepID=A0ABT4JT86_9GAMM|nr:LysR family transcriptional regulator [Marinomonas sp. 15G1-11]MCZ2721598.1 LysR family transcriptional regulator [Marinomonas sp. 15G1-11]
MLIDPTSLRLFVCVIEQGSIAKAAELNFIAASAISKRIKELEQLLHTPLMMRTNRGVVATPAGKALLQMSRGVLHQLDDIYNQMNEFSHGLRGQVRMVANISAISQFLPKQLRSFLNQNPQVQIHLEEKISSEIVRAVAENSADIGIVTIASREYTDLSIYPYKTDRLVVITPVGHPLGQFKEINYIDTLDYDYVGLHTGSAINNQMLKASEAESLPLNMRIQVTSYEALCSMVESGLGIGLMPIDIARPYIKASRIEALPLLDSWAHRELKICVRSSDQLFDAAHHLLNHLRTT